ncbi:MAG: hypothetical protein IJ043_12095 [Clostridia bacterium]|nr:hypothetical protein [Clostridia bacterium]
MKKRLRWISVLLICLTFISAFDVNVFADTDSSSGVTPRYNNVVSVSTVASVSDSGLLTIVNNFEGVKGVITRGVVTTYIHKKFLGLFWQKVDIGQTDNEWVDNAYTYSYDGVITFQLPSTGTYRITSEFVIYGTGGAADTITCQVQKTY